MKRVRTTETGRCSPYAEPQVVEDQADCVFYHVMDLPSLGTVGGHWDLRDGVDTYLGEIDYSGARVLDIGTASGYLTFAMEARGAEVVSFDLDAPTRRELVPFADPRYSLEAVERRFADLVPGQRRAYWLAHRLLRSRARAVYGSILDLPDVGVFDVLLFGMILPHLRDPFAALASLCRYAGETVVVTQQAPRMRDSWAYFMPDPSTLQPDAAWWALSEDCIVRMLAVLGFCTYKILRRSYSCPLRGDEEECATFVARRQVPLGGYGGR